jgi:hypothetical protein
MDERLDEIEETIRLEIYFRRIVFDRNQTAIDSSFNDDWMVLTIEIYDRA